MEQISISDIQRKLHKLKEFDIVEIVDKKRNLVKGYFLDIRYTLFIQDLLEQKIHSKSLASKLAGSLNAYAIPSLLDDEKTAWEKHTIEKYQQ